ncbi:DUF155 domain-containing protein [Aphelenchoides fujianensis]|nr:DUF155 domain-containing protein [Aphelenchoides fujianensis]
MQEPFGVSTNSFGSSFYGFSQANAAPPASSGRAAPDHGPHFRLPTVLAAFPLPIVLWGSPIPSALTAVRSTHSQPNKTTLITPPLVTSNARRANRRRRSLAEIYKNQQVSDLPQVLGIARAEAFDLFRIVDDRELFQLYQITFVDDDNEDTLHVTLREEYRFKEAIKDAFVFSDGVIVSWNMERPEVDQLIEFLHKFEIEPYNPTLIQQETENMSFTYSSGSRVSIKNELITLTEESNDATGHNTDVFTRVSRSPKDSRLLVLKVAIWERQLNEYAEPLNATTKSLMRGVIPWKRRETLKRTGEFAALRQSINLDSGLLNADFYWEREDLEKHYKQSKRYFVIDKRLRDLNSRLDYCQNLVNIIDNMLTHRHASFLEWMIILLIVIEVIFDLLQYFDVDATPVYMVDDPQNSADSKNGNAANKQPKKPQAKE